MRKQKASRFISFSVSLAEEFGLEESIILQQIHYWCELNKKNGNGELFDNAWWVFSSHSQWVDRDFRWMTERTLQRRLSELEKKELITSRVRPLKRLLPNRTKMYRILYSNLSSEQHAELERCIVPDWQVAIKEKEDNKKEDTVGSDNFFEEYWVEYHKICKEKGAQTGSKSHAKNLYEKTFDRLGFPLHKTMHNALEHFKQWDYGIPHLTTFFGRTAGRKNIESGLFDSPPEAKVSAKTARQYEWLPDWVVNSDHFSQAIDALKTLKTWDGLSGLLSGNTKVIAKGRIGMGLFNIDVRPLGSLWRGDEDLIPKPFVKAFMTGYCNNAPPKEVYVINRTATMKEMVLDENSENTTA